MSTEQSHTPPSDRANPSETTSRPAYVEQAGAGRRNGLVAGAVVGTVVLMLGAAFASVPLYRAFCQLTGYGGTTQVAKTAPALRGKRSLVVRFDTNIGAGLPWTFLPEVSQVTLQTGETATVFFKVKNLAKVPVTAQAAYNVSPDQAGSFFDKINCFCFNEQTLAAGESVDMPVVFFLDPALEKDETMSGVDAVTLSYTFYPVRSQPVAAASDRPKL